MHTEHKKGCVPALGQLSPKPYIVGLVCALSAHESTEAQRAGHSNIQKHQFHHCQTIKLQTASCDFFSESTPQVLARSQVMSACIPPATLSTAGDGG